MICKQKRGQITVFIILGIIILLSFAFLLYFSSSAGKQKSKASSLEEIRKTFDSESFQYYVSSCLTNNFEEGLMLIGERGGYLHPDDYKDKSNHLNQFNPKYTRDKTAYLIEKGDLAGPWYPCQDNSNPPVYCGFINNRILFPESEGFVYGIYNVLSGYFLKKQLESYLNDRMGDCINISDLKKRYVTIDIENMTFSSVVEFTANEMSANVDYSIKIRYGKESMPYYINSKTKLPVRFGSVYGAIVEVINNDFSKLDFDMYNNPRTGSYNGVPLNFGLIGGLMITKEAVPESTDDLFIINDSLSIIKGKPYVFKFARENRIPVLDCIPAVNSTEREIIKNRNLEFIKIAKFGYGETPKNNQHVLEINANAIDPDEDYLTYSYSQRTFPYFSNWPAAVSPDQNKILFEVADSDAGYHNISVEVSDSEYKDSQEIRIFVERLLRSYDLSYENFYPSLPNKYYVSIEDPFYFGFNHASLFDQPDPLLDPKYNYKVIVNNVEIFNRDINFRPNEQKYYLTLPNIGFPSQPTLSPSFFPSISEIKMDYLNKIPSLNNQNTFTNSNVILKITSSGLVPQVNLTTLPIEFKYCFPIQTEYYIYPYNKIKKNDYSYNSGIVDEYNGSHDCCKSDYSLAGSTKECFNLEYYTSMPYSNRIYFPQNLAKSVDSSGGVNSVIPSGPSYSGSLSDDRGNDIFKRIYTQSCVAWRGNVCGGQIRDTWQISKDCKDKGAGEAERCQGPARYPSLSLPETLGTFYSLSQGKYLPLSAANITLDSLGNPVCYNYTRGETFEKNFNISGTGICNMLYNVKFYCDGKGGCTEIELPPCSQITGCVDSDMGLNSDVIGFAVKGCIRIDDSCFGLKVNETRCYQNNLNSQLMDCGPGRSCRYGACT